jgi:hypothetical protein
MEKVLQNIYKGQTNVAVAAQELNIPVENLKKIFIDYAAQHPITQDAWEECEELSWPFS